MAYVNMNKDFSEVDKPIPSLGLTKRQLKAFCFGIAVGLISFFIFKFGIGTDAKKALVALFITALPISVALLYKKDGMYLEKHLKFYYETHFLRNTDRPYETENYYDYIRREKQFKEEVEKIVLKDKTQAEINRIKKNGEKSTIKVGNKKIVIPGNGPVSKETKIELEKAIKKAKLKGEIPESAQDTIPYKIPYEDGIFELEDNYFTMAVAYEDITYQLLDADPKSILFDRWCNLINCFDDNVHVQYLYGNIEMNKKEYDKNFIIPKQEDGLDIIRSEYSNMQKNQYAKGTNNLSKERYLIFGIQAQNKKAATVKLGKFCKQVERHMKRIGSKVRVMNGTERLELLHRMFHPGTDKKLVWNFDLQVRTGLSSKDMIAPSSFSFKPATNLGAAKTFTMGDWVGAASYVRIDASAMEDRIVNDILNIDSNIWLAIHTDGIPRRDSLKYAQDNISDIDSMIIHEQKDASQKGFDWDLLPPQYKVLKEAAEKLYKDLQGKNEKLFNGTIIIVQIAESMKKLEENIFELNNILQGHQCALVRLDDRQEQGFVSALPLGVNKIEVKRTFSTTELGAFIPFTTAELFSPQGQYYGMNSLSNKVVSVNRKKLINPNGLVFGAPGFGKSFFVKREILDVFLKTLDDIMVIDPEGEYKWLVKLLRGQNISVSLKSKYFINPMEINLFSKSDDDDDFDPIASKTNFVKSMCELILANYGFLTKEEMAVIDEACQNIYRRFAKNPVPENQPILGTLLDELQYNIKDDEAIKKEHIARTLALRLYPYVYGSLSYFNHRSNIDINKRLVCFGLKNMDKLQKELTMLIIQDAIWSRVRINREKGKSTWVYIDELHVFLRMANMAEYFVDMWKRFRKWAGIPTGITQNIKDLFKSEEIQNILDVTNFIAMLNQKGNDIRILSEHLELSEDEEDYLCTGEEGKGLLYIQETKIPFEDKFPKNTISYKVMTSKPNEVLKKRKEAV